MISSRCDIFDDTHSLTPSDVEYYNSFNISQDEYEEIEKMMIAGYEREAEKVINSGKMDEYILKANIVHDIDKLIVSDIIMEREKNDTEIR